MKDENKHDINLIQRKLVEMASNDNSCANELQLFDGAPMPIVTGLSCSIEYDKFTTQYLSLCLCYQLCTTLVRSLWTLLLVSVCNKFSIYAILEFHAYLKRPCLEERDKNLYAVSFAH